MEIKNINSREFTSILLKGKTIKFQDFRFLAICYFRKDVMEKFLEDILQSKETLNYTYENCQLSPNKKWRNHRENYRNKWRPIQLFKEIKNERCFWSKVH